MKIFGQFPGGRHLGDDEIKNVTDVISSRSPWHDAQHKAITSFIS